MLNNPVRFTDPTGYAYCAGPMDPACHETGGISWEIRGKLAHYSYLVREVFQPYPNPDQIYNSSWNTPERVAGTLENYEAIRKLLFLQSGMAFLTSSGKIFDTVLMPLFAAGEFGSFNPNSAVYKEAVEGLSNQYYSEKDNPGPMQCEGECTLLQQLRWATQMQAFYWGDEIVNIVREGTWKNQLVGALMAVRKYHYGRDESWFWGNVSDSGLQCYVVSSRLLTYVYPGKPWFIVYSGQIYGCYP